MAAALKQKDRLGSMSTALGADVLALLRFSGTDFVNDLFSYQIEALSTDPDLDFDRLIGTHMSVEIESPEHGPQAFDGIVTEAQWAGAGENGCRYKFTLRPWLWVAGRRRTQRIFHNKSVVDILTEVFQAYSGLGRPAFKNMLSGQYAPLEYTVQYRESDQAFATRMMERFGISYHFIHEAGSHTLVLTDAIDNHGAIAGDAREYKPVTGAKPTGAEYFWQWQAGRRMTTGAVRLTDYNFKKPKAAMEVDRIGDAKYEQGQIEAYEYPGDYLTQSEGDALVKTRALQERGQDSRHHATGDCMSLRAGLTVKLEGDELPAAKQIKYLCLTATHNFTANAYGTGAGFDSDQGYHGAYVLMPSTGPLAPERKTPVPVVQGPQTAVVVGEGEIDCDEYGRILVHFHWDLDKAYSMRCRVSQNWASKGWGGMVIPRIGMEVIVEFLEGDPDKPVVTGCVYNGQNDPPYPLPANKTRSVFKSDTHKGTGFNELRIEDEAGREEIYLHAQKDRNEKTLNNHSERIDNNWVQSVGHNKSIEVTNNHVEQIGGNLAISVGPAGIGQIVNAAIARVAGGISSVSRNLGIPGALNAGEGNMSLVVEKARSETIGTISATNIGVSSFTNIGISSELQVGKTLSSNVGEKSYETVGKQKAIDVGDQLIITVGASRLVMKKDGTILLKGKEISVEGSDKINIVAPTVNIKGSGKVVINGGKIDMN